MAIWTYESFLLDGVFPSYSVKILKKILIGCDKRKKSLEISTHFSEKYSAWNRERKLILKIWKHKEESLHKELESKTEKKLRG